VIMADVFKIVFLVLGALLVLVSYWLASAALFPAWIGRARIAYDHRPVRSTIVGIAVAAPLSILGVALMNSSGQPVLMLTGGLIVSIPVFLALAGSAGLALRIGAGLATPGDELAPWRRVLRGGIVLSLTFLLPVLGWFIVFPFALVSGVGAALLAFRTPAPAVATTTGISG
jgi:hypothetical protein